MHKRVKPVHSQTGLQVPVIAVVALGINIGGLIMNIFDFALQMELDGEKYYREMASGTKHNDLKQVLEGLADDEKRHYQIIQSAQNQTFGHIQLEDDPSLRSVRNIFSIDNCKEPAGKNDLIEKLKEEQSDIYRAALRKEQESVELYRKLKEDAEEDETKKIFTTLMQEEEKHVDVIENIIEMLNHVNDWVESAEFNLKGEKY